MKIDFNRKYNTIAAYVMIILVLGIVAITAVLNYQSIGSWIGGAVKILSPFVGGFAVAYILNPILNFYERLFETLFQGKLKSRPSRVLSLVFTYITAGVILTMFFHIVIPQVTASVTGLASQVKDWLPRVEEWVYGLIEKYDVKNWSLSEFEQGLIDKLFAAAEQFVKNLTTTATTAITVVAQTAVSITNVVINTILALLISVYLLFGKETFLAQIKKLFTALLPGDLLRLARRMVLKSHQIFSGFIGGKLLDSCIIGVLCFAAMSLLGWPYAMLISVIVGITNVIPFFGPFIGAVPSILIMMISSPKLALFLAILILVLQQLDGNIIGPKILGDSIGLPPLWVIFAITFFGSVWGILGMFIGVPTFAVIYYMIREWTAWRLEKKGLPADTAAYVSNRTTMDSAKEESKKKQPPKESPSKGTPPEEEKKQ